MPSISEILLKATETLRAAGISNPRREAASLLAFTLEKNKAFLIAHDDYELSGEEETKFQEFTNRRASREPFQYITGCQEFYGLEFIVTPEVLIPRPETELIVENAIEIMSEIEKPRFCEVGTGSGCISISILHEVKTATAIGLDISAKALEITRLNAAKHEVSDKLQLKISDIFDGGVNEKFHLIISNPPYIPLKNYAELQSEVRDYEPQIALTDGGNGILIIKKIIKDSPEFLKAGGFLLLEIGFEQAQEVFAMFDMKKWRELEILPDLQGIPRMVKAQIRAEA